MRWGEVRSIAYERERGACTARPEGQGTIRDIAVICMVWAKNVKKFGLTSTAKKFDMNDEEMIKWNVSN